MSHSAQATDDKEEVTSFEQQVNEAASSMVLGKDDLWHLPEDSDLSEEVAYAANLEKRRRDTQSAAAKTSHQLEASEEHADKLQSKLKEHFVPKLSKTEQEELEDLKSSDPDAYHSKLNEYETAAKQAFDEELIEMGYNADEIDEMADRSVQLADFLESNPGLRLDDEVFENDLPPRLVKQLEEGEISFDDFLVEAKNVLQPKGKKEVEEPNLNKAGGGSNADDKAVDKDAEASYVKVIF